MNPGETVPRYPQTSMLYFYCANPEEVKSIRETGLSASGASFFSSLDEAERACREKILVANAFAVDAHRISPDADGMSPDADRMSPDVIVNADPYARPKRVTAAGGFVTRRRRGMLELLMIYRRGVWDLPKGKRDKGESIAECAVREVREELGIESVTLGRSLGTTIHGYLEKRRYMVKTTYWYEMSTGAENFTPQEEESIEKVSWMPWSDARKKMGFETLRRHMDRVEDLL